MRRLVCAVCASCALLVAVPSQAASPRVVLGWNFGSGTTTYVAQDARAPGLNTLSPGWWMLREDGSVSDTGSSRYATWARAHHMRLWPMFTNNIDQVASRKAMTDPVTRAKVITRVRDLAHAYGVDGVNIDWENLATSDRDSFSSFVREAAASWHAAGLVVSIDVTARTDTWQLDNWTESMDRKALGAAADYVILMAYDEHNRLRPNGPTASLPWVEASVRFLLRSVPSSKVVLGVPFYTNDWDLKTGHGETVTFAYTPAHLRAHHAAVTFDTVQQQNVATYVLGGHTHKVWIEDARSLQAKAALVTRYGLAGVAAWRIGFETPEAWNAITSAPAATSPPLTVRPSATAAKPVATVAPATPARTTVAAPSLLPTKPASKRAALPLVAAMLAFLSAFVVTLFARAKQKF